MGTKPEARFAFIQERAAEVAGAHRSVATGTRLLVRLRPTLQTAISEP